MTGADQAHVGEPVAQDAAQRFGAGGVAVDNHREHAAGEMARVVPTLHFDRLGHRGILAPGSSVGAAAIEHQAIHHRLQPGRRLIPVHRSRS
jgi:hypothetical protein